MKQFRCAASNKKRDMCFNWWIFYRINCQDGPVIDGIKVNTGRNGTSRVVLLKHRPEHVWHHAGLRTPSMQHINCWVPEQHPHLWWRQTRPSQILLPSRARCQSLSRDSREAEVEERSYLLSWWDLSNYNEFISWSCQALVSRLVIIICDAFSQNRYIIAKLQLQMKTVKFSTNTHVYMHMLPPSQWQKVLNYKVMI